MNRKKIKVLKYQVYIKYMTYTLFALKTFSVRKLLNTLYFTH